MPDLTYWNANGAGYSASAPSENYSVLLPKFYKADRTRRCVIACHGLLGSAFGWITGMLELRTFAAMGFPCIHADMGGFATWGNDTAILRITEAWNFMKLGFGVAQDVFVGYGQSMGAPALLNYMRANPEDMAAMAAEVPVIGLDETHDRDPLSLAGSIEAAYGGSGAYEAAISTNDPFYSPNLFTHATLDIPTKFWVAADDPICSFSVAQTWASVGAGEIVSMGNVGHTVLPSPYYAEVARFLRPYVFRQTAKPGRPTIRRQDVPSDILINA